MNIYLLVQSKFIRLKVRMIPNVQPRSAQMCVKTHVRIPGACHFVRSGKPGRNPIGKKENHRSQQSDEDLAKQIDRLPQQIIQYFTEFAGNPGAQAQRDHPVLLLNHH